ncbi:MAG: DNA-protecting protein DprA [Rhodospirillaceae bacterium]|jgi:DNA processing protein|nr:DNA-protecting protein DprA [Rhodospirillaceae bacterium]MBT4588767.1 DNA-protecting protein DprA [Rhodospirillaceae bacterium]MBT4939920.1 DNA-protecting protein DprA [Rhodospirillaceae bacterium]MBT5939507.1 DNA-protecting protein DprA [Rhodospirillaceae bacterium]MBT7267762.1 DNA-protecting protein DprA [Rhodospirillaceae bacterium]
MSNNTQEVTRRLSAAEKCAWLRLIRSERVGPITFYKLLEQFGSVEAALTALPDLAKSGGAKRFRLCSKADAEAELEKIEAAGASLIARGEPDYPPLLAHIEDAPPVLFIKGHPHLLKKKAIGMVGTRNASINGHRIAASFAKGFGEAGFLVSSGMARGIDTSSHEGALATGTVAVLAGGVDIVYPKENQNLYEQICETGVVISEMPVGTVPQARHFPRRNRIISGAARGIVVIEAAKRSGSLITARMALEQNREVFAVPGSPLDPRAKGTNELIRQGAHLADSGEEIIQILNEQFMSPLTEPEPFEIKQQNKDQPNQVEITSAWSDVQKILNTSPVSVDEIIRRCHMSPAVVSWILLEIELAGRLERHPGNQVSIISDIEI